MVHKNVGLKMNFWIKNSFDSKIEFGSKNVGVQNVWVKQDFGPKNKDTQNIGSKKFGQDWLSNTWDIPNMDECC